MEQSFRKAGDEMEDQFMQEIEEEKDTLGELEQRVRDAAGGNVAVEAADELIRANGEAQAIEVETLKDTVASYQSQIDELKALYHRNSALVQEICRMNVETTKGVQDVMEVSAKTISENSDALQNVDFSKLQEESKAAVEEASAKVLASIEESQQKIEGLLQQSDDFAHKENVRVYRNVQAATEQLLQKQTSELKTELDAIKKTQKPAVTWAQIVTMLLAAASVILILLQYFGVM